ncbi:hypothetical protein [Streptomyces sp. CBMA29]|uniref:hypothetical protein n=1 Tax=Streptomyces sp. CBMA29 TaxID=1896314 RepID=UPI00166196C7|nr:hypothetical protein [Streptomyces sp. CBMA29]
MNMDQHRKAIEAALQAASDDGFTFDDQDFGTPHVDINSADGDDYTEIRFPE